MTPFSEGPAVGRGRVPVTRRALLRYSLSGVGIALLAACAPAAPGPSSASPTAAPKPTTATNPTTAEFIAQPEAAVGPACCCPARPAVRVIMPPSPSRPHATGLLLCGHHYLVSKSALTAARAVVHELPDTPPDIASWVGIAREDPPEPVA